MSQRGTQVRSGIATMWLIVSAPVMLLVLCAVLEIGQLWVARGELVKALEAASLAAAKHWAAGNSTTDARNAAISLAGANTVRGVAVVLTDNENLGNPNGNDDCNNGDIVLGGLDPAGSNAFNGSSVPSCGASKSFKVDLTVTTMGSPSGTTFNFADAFEIDYQSGPAGVTIKSVTYDLQAFGDDGVFQPGPGGTDPMGYGPVDGTITGTIGSPSYAFSGANSQLKVTFSTTGAAAFDMGEEFKFGVDTDMVGSPDTDKGGAFGVIPSMMPPNPGVQITIEFSDGTAFVVPKLMRLGPNTSSRIGNLNIVIPDVDFAVRTQASVSVPSLCKLFGPFTISAKADAAFRCSGSKPQLVRFSSFTCP